MRARLAIVSERLTGTRRPPSTSAPSSAIQISASIAGEQLERRDLRARAALLARERRRSSSKSSITACAMRRM